MLTRTMKGLRAIASRLREDRGDLVVAPLTILTVMALTAVFAGGIYVYAKKTAPSVNAARQGLVLDDDGNVVNGAVGVIPVKTPKPTPEPTPEPAPKVVHRTRVVDSDPAPAPQQPPTITYVDPGTGYQPPHDDGTSSSSSHTETESSGGTSGGTCCPSGGGGGGGGGHGGGGGGHGH